MLLNRAPHISAGPDLALEVVEIGQLYGSYSDPDGDLITIEWLETDTNPESSILSAADAENPTLAPYSRGVYICPICNRY